MRQVYSFDETNIPLWVYTLFWLLYVLGFMYSVQKIFFPPNRVKFQISGSHSFYSVRKIFSPKNRVKSQLSGSYFFLLYFILFAIFYCVNPDYFRYRDWIYGRDFGFWAKENVYIAIIYLCRSLPVSYPYEVFRLIVWGGAILIAYLSSFLYGKQLKPLIVILFLFVLFCGGFCYARASLAMAIYFCGSSVLLNAKKKKTIILGWVIAMSSFFFHHELLIGIVVLPCIFIPFEKRKAVVASFGIFALVIFAISFLFSNLDILTMLFGNEELSSQIEGFNEKEQRTFRLSTLVSYMTYLYPFYLFTEIPKKKKRFPDAIIGLYRLSFGIIMIAIAFMFLSGVRSVFTYRILYMSMIPISIMTAYFYNNKQLKKDQLIVMFILGLLTNSIRFINA